MEDETGPTVESSSGLQRLTLAAAVTLRARPIEDLSPAELNYSKSSSQAPGETDSI